MVWITVNLFSEVCHHSKLCGITTQVDVEMLHIVRRAFPPLVRVIRCVILVVDDGWFAILRTGRAVEIETVKPNTSAIQLFPRMMLV